MIFQLKDLDSSTSCLLPPGCLGCGWWQGHDEGWTDGEASAWSQSAAEIFGPWGKLAMADGQVLGMVQYGPAGLFRRASMLPAGPVSNHSLLLTCCNVAEKAGVSVRRSLVTAIMAEQRRRGIQTIEAFIPGKDRSCRFFEEDLLKEVGFACVRRTKGMKLMRLEMGGMEPAEEHYVRRSLLERLKRSSSAPAPVAMAVPLARDPERRCPQRPVRRPLAASCSRHG